MPRPLIWLVTLLGGVVPPATAAHLTVGPFLQAPRPDGAVVVWETDAPSAGAVLIEVGDAKVLRHDSPGPAVHHEVALHGLAPAGSYRYRLLVDGEPLGEPGVLPTLPAPGQPLTFAVFGDTRSDAAAHTACIRALSEHPVSFVVHTGDMVGSGEIEEEWTEFFALEAPLVREVPLLPVIGNHDAHEGLPGPPYTRLFVPPESGREHETYYSFRAGNAHFVVLDSQTSVLPEFVCTQQILWWDACLDEAQRAWLEADLTVAAADPVVEHVFVFAHEGPYSSKEGRTGWAELRWLLPWFASSKVTAIFSGHDHLYERGRSINGLAYVVSGGGGAPLYEPETEQSQEVHPREVIRNEVTYNFQIVELDGPLARVSTYECDGGLLEAFELRAAEACADADDCGGGQAGSCPGAWACDRGRCRWACPDEPECVTTAMCAGLEPGGAAGAFACVKGACSWQPGEAGVDAGPEGTEGPAHPDTAEGQPKDDVPGPAPKPEPDPEPGGGGGCAPAGGPAPSGWAWLALVGAWAGRFLHSRRRICG